MKNEFKGTEGNWTVDIEHASVYSQYDGKKEVIEGNIICDAPVGWEKQILNWEANAKLIACAPEMLETLQSIVKEYDLDIVHGIDAKKIRELIQKATS